MVEISEEEQRVWKYLVAHRLAGADEIALNCDVPLDLAESCLARVGTPREIFELELTSVEEPAPAQPREVKPTRVQTLETAIRLTGGDRNKSYGPPFDNLSDCANLWNAYINSKWGCLALQPDGAYSANLKAEDVAWLMVLVKMTRSFNPGYHPDNYTDAAAYSAIAGECREIQNQEDGN